MGYTNIAILIKTAALEFDKMSNPVLSEYGLTISQYRVLKFLYSQPSQRARIVDIEKDCSITHPTVLGLLENLEKNGFVRKIVNPEDARSKLVTVTDKARNMQDRLEKTGTSLNAVLTQNLTGNEKKQLESLLKKMVERREKYAYKRGN